MAISCTFFFFLHKETGISLTVWYHHWKAFSKLKNASSSDYSLLFLSIPKSLNKTIVIGDLGVKSCQRTPMSPLTLHSLLSVSKSTFVRVQDAHIMVKSGHPARLRRNPTAFQRDYRMHTQQGGRITQSGGICLIFYCECNYICWNVQSMAIKFEFLKEHGSKQ